MRKKVKKIDGGGTKLRPPPPDHVTRAIRSLNPCGGGGRKGRGGGWRRKGAWLGDL